MVVMVQLLTRQYKNKIATPRIFSSRLINKILGNINIYFELNSDVQVLDCV